MPCRTTEGVEGLSVQVDILVGLLARNLSVLFETVDGTAIGACLIYLLYRLLLFVRTIQHYWTCIYIIIYMCVCKVGFELFFNLHKNA